MARQDQNQALIIEMLGLLNRIESALVVRDPGSKVSADAYDGLRKMLLQSSKNRRIHVSHLLSLSDSLNRDASMQLVKDRVNDFMTELGVSYWSDTSVSELFDVMDGEGTQLECVEPAVVEKLEDGRIVEVRRGTARRVPGPEPEASISGHTNSDLDRSELTEDTRSESSVAPESSLNLANNDSRRPSSTLLVAIASIVLGFLLGFIAFSGSNDTPEKSSTTTMAATSTTAASTTTTEAGK